MEKAAGTSSRNGARDRTVYFKLPSPEMEPWKIKAAGTSPGVDALLLVSPAPEMVVEIEPSMARKHLQRWNRGKGMYQLWIYT